MATWSSAVICVESMEQEQPSMPIRHSVLSLVQVKASLEELMLYLPRMNISDLYRSPGSSPMSMSSSQPQDS